MVDIKTVLASALKEPLANIRFGANKGFVAMSADTRLVEQLPDIVIDAIHAAGFTLIRQPSEEKLAVAVTHSHPGGNSWRDQWRVQVTFDGGETAFWAEQEVQSPMLQHTNPDGFRQELTRWLSDALMNRVSWALRDPISKAVAVEDVRRRAAAQEAQP